MSRIRIACPSFRSGRRPLRLRTARCDRAVPRPSPHTLDHRHDARAQRNGASLQTPRITLAVEALVMAQHDFVDCRGSCNGPSSSAPVSGCPLTCFHSFSVSGLAGDRSTRSLIGIMPMSRRTRHRRDRASLLRKVHFARHLGNQASKPLGHRTAGLVALLDERDQSADDADICSSVRLILPAACPSRWRPGRSVDRKSRSRSGRLPRTLPPSSRTPRKPPRTQGRHEGEAHGAP